MYLKNPGIAPDLIARTMMHSQKFFNLPLSIHNEVNALKLKILKLFPYLMLKGASHFTIHKFGGF